MFRDEQVADSLPEVVIRRRLKALLGEEEFDSLLSEVSSSGNAFTAALNSFLHKSLVALLGSGRRCIVSIRGVRYLAVYLQPVSHKAGFLTCHIFDSPAGRDVDVHFRYLYEAVTSEDPIFYKLLEY